MTRTRILAVFVSLLAITATAAAEDPSWLLPGHLLEKDGTHRRIWLLSATGNSIRYHATPDSKEVTERPTSDGTAVILDEPPEFGVAMTFYLSRKFAEAGVKFREVRQRYQPLAELKDNPSTLAAFYETECLRKSGDLEGLATARMALSKAPLTRESQLRQLELAELWEAVRLQKWERVETLAGGWEKTLLPGDQRAQVAFCQGLAHEALGRSEEALVSYQIALTADAGASEEVVRPAALRILAIHQADGEVQEALKLRGTKDEDKKSPAVVKLAEAAAVARLFQLSLGGEMRLPPEYEKFLSGPQQ